MKNIVIVSIIVFLSCFSACYGFAEWKAMRFPTAKERKAQSVAGKIERGLIQIGMSKNEMLNMIGYPPEGTSRPTIFTKKAIKKKVTANGTEEKWNYYAGTIAGAFNPTGLQYVTFTLINNRITEWEEWVEE